MKEYITRINNVTTVQANSLEEAIEKAIDAWQDRINNHQETIDISVIEAESHGRTSTEDTAAWDEEDILNIIEEEYKLITGSSLPDRFTDILIGTEYDDNTTEEELREEARAIIEDIIFENL